MIVTPAQASAIHTGRKTRHTRPLHTTALKPGHDYPVNPGKGKPASCRLRVLSAAVERLGNLTYKDAVAEGFKTTGAFKVAWIRAHDYAWIKRELVDLAAVFDDHCSCVDWMLVKRFDTHWADQLAHVITFERVVDEPRFMADQRRANAGQYVRSPSRSIDSTAECVDEAFQARITAHAAKRGAEMRARARAGVEAEMARRKAERGRSMRLPPAQRRAA